MIERRTITDRAMKVTYGDFLKFSPEQRRSYMREVIAFWQENHNRECQLDMEADQRAASRGTIDASGPIDETGQYAHSGTNRATP